MTQKFTVLFDLDGTLVDTAPDLMMAHNHVMKKFGYQTKTTEEIRELVERPGIVKSRDRLMEIAYNDELDVDDRTIDSHIKRIRKKFRKIDPKFNAIHTLYGSGYQWK